MWQRNRSCTPIVRPFGLTIRSGRVHGPLIDSSFRPLLLHSTPRAHQVRSAAGRPHECNMNTFVRDGWGMGERTHAAVALSPTAAPAVSHSATAASLRSCRCSLPAPRPSPLLSSPRHCNGHVHGRACRQRVRHAAGGRSRCVAGRHGHQVRAADTATATQPLPLRLLPASSPGRLHAADPVQMHSNSLHSALWLHDAATATRIACACAMAAESLTVTLALSAVCFALLPRAATNGAESAAATG